jgi:hypothetical protein
VVATDPEALFFEAIANSFNNMDPHLVDIDIIHPGLHTTWENQNTRSNLNQLTRRIYAPDISLCSKSSSLLRLPEEYCATTQCTKPLSNIQISPFVVNLELGVCCTSGPFESESLQSKLCSNLTSPQCSKTVWIFKSRS